NYWPNVYKGKQDANTYDPGPLDLTVTYYWRIDEVNDTNDERWTGDPWRFKVADYLIIDNFDDDTAQDPPENDWYKGSVLGTGATISLRSTPPIIGEHSMRYDYTNFFDWGPPYNYYSEIQTKNLEPNDWDYYDVKTISLWFYGNSGNNATEYETQMNLGLEDDSNYAVVWYGELEGEEITDVQVEEWQLWEIRTNRYTNINFSDVKKICIGFGTRGWPIAAGAGVVYFDEINLFVPTCMPELNPLDGDFNADCTADWQDVEIMADDWLEADVNLSPVQAPGDANLVGWWKLDEPGSPNATDYAGYDNNGVIETLNTNVFWADAGHDGNALNFDGGRVLVPDANALRPKYEVTACAWVKYYSTHDESARVVVKGADNKETFGLEVSDEGDVCVLLVREGNNPGASSYKSYDANSYELEHGDWTHLAGTFKQGDCIKVYVNGELEATNNDANAIEYLSQNTSGLAIGNRSDATNRAFEGLIDDVRVYDRALSAAEVAYIATDETGIFTVQSAANIYNLETLGDRAVNLRDFAKLANNWLVRKLWPE
ncbi:MAG: LamG domain-containing protein, partial [Planctomycetota bacterium]